MAEKTESSEIVSAVVDTATSSTSETPPQHVPDFFKNAPDALHNRTVDFGKHKALTFQQLATDQKKYVNWLFSQTWFNYRYPELYEYLKLVGLGLENSKSPVHHRKEDIDDAKKLQKVQTHNELQVRFTDSEQLLDLVQRVLGADSGEVYTVRSVTFEHWCGADIEVLVTQTTPVPGMLMNSSTLVNHTLLFELKPSVSDDYPDVLRQIRGQLYSHGIFRKQTGVLDDKITQVLVTQRYDGSAPLENVKKMYGNVPIVFVV